MALQHLFVVQTCWEVKLPLVNQHASHAPPDHEMVYFCAWCGPLALLSPQALRAAVMAATTHIFTHAMVVISGAQGRWQNQTGEPCGECVPIWVYSVCELREATKCFVFPISNKHPTTNPSWLHKIFSPLSIFFFVLHSLLHMYNYRCWPAPIATLFPGTF